MELSLATLTSTLGEKQTQKTEIIIDHAYLMTPQQWRTGSFQANKHIKRIGEHNIQNEYHSVVHFSPQGPLVSLHSFLANYKKHISFLISRLWNFLLSWTMQSEYSSSDTWVFITWPLHLCSLTLSLRYRNQTWTELLDIPMASVKLENLFYLESTLAS